MIINSYCEIMSTLVLILNFPRWVQERERVNPITVGIHMITRKRYYRLLQFNFKHRSGTHVLCRSELHVLGCVQARVWRYNLCHNSEIKSIASSTIMSSSNRSSNVLRTASTSTSTTTARGREGVTSRGREGGREGASSARASTSTSTSHGRGGASSSAHGRGGASSSARARALLSAVPIENRHARATNQHLSPSPSRALGRRATQERVIVELELEVEELRAKCETYRELVDELRAEMGKLMLKGCTKKQLRESLCHSEADDRYAFAIGKLTREWLFPRFKFLHKNWMNYTNYRKGLPRMIFQRCPIPEGSTVLDMWNRLVAPTVSRNYSTMRCNVNKEVRNAFKGELGFLEYVILLLRHTPHSHPNSSSFILFITSGSCEEYHRSGQACEGY